MPTKCHIPSDVRDTFLLDELDGFLDIPPCSKDNFVTCVEGSRQHGQVSGDVEQRNREEGDLLRVRRFGKVDPRTQGRNDQS